jgi:endonuclease/exonuclease/phosphatase family metal-dependent hydrolase
MALGTCDPICRVTVRATEQLWRANGSLLCCVLLLAAFLLSSCRTGQNYLSPEGPRYAGKAAASQPAHGGDTLRIVSFNIAYARQVDSALAVLTGEADLRSPDILLLQEMDEPATRRIAHTLRLHYVYYPAILHLRNRRDFGNAVLSRWPIVEDTKIALPHTGRLASTQRIATAATIRVRETLVRVYSAHLGTFVDVTPEGRRDQLQQILTDAAKYPRVVVGGDMNSSGVGQLARERGYRWPTEHGPRTALAGRLDHIFLKGLSSPDSAAAGTVSDQRRASDHRPVWARAVIR